MQQTASAKRMDFLWSLIIGGVAGWLAGRIMKGEGYGVLINVVLGIVGGLVGAWIFSVLGISADNLFGHLVCATVGAVALIALARAIRK